MACKFMAWKPRICSSLSCIYYTWMLHPSCQEDKLGLSTQALRGWGRNNGHRSQFWCFAAEAVRPRLPMQSVKLISVMTFPNFNLSEIRVFLLAISNPFYIVLVMKFVVEPFAFVGSPFYHGFFPQLLLQPNCYYSWADSWAGSWAEKYEPRPQTSTVLHSPCAAQG